MVWPTFDFVFLDIGLLNAFKRQCLFSKVMMYV